MRSVIKVRRNPSCRSREARVQAIEAGNAQSDSHSGWFVGSFLPTELGLRFSKDVEVKWGVHVRGEAKQVTAANSTATTLTILVQGFFVMSFPDHGESVELSEPADYVLYAPGIAHHWIAKQPSTVLTVRWPSAVGDQVAVETGIKEGRNRYRGRTQPTDETLLAEN